ncbi:MAG: Ig-like domain-containing protein, partial [Anaerolineae bacterium]|nr:Ig-like domain-containing protein [Anaerolineae bacterium]
MNNRKIHLVLSILVLISLLACSLPKAKTSTPAPSSTASAQGVATPTRKAATTQPKATNTTAPTPTSGPTPTPLPPTAPLLLYREPERGEELDVNSPLVLTFDQAMDKSSVEKAFSIEPEVKGTFEWAADRVLMFKPAQPWAREAVYHISVGTTAKSTAGLPLRQDIGFRFVTTGFLTVTQAQPTDETVEVAMDSRVTVMFNRPVVPLVAVADMVNLPQPLSFDPPVEGKGEWLNTSIYVWTPSDGFAPSTTYNVTVGAGLQDTTGGVLAEDYAWSFTTQMPRVTLIYPRDNSQYVGPSDIISVTFNQPMDVASVESKFSLNHAELGAVKGRFIWSEDRTSFQFAPADDLPRARLWTAKIDQGALGAGGQHGTEKAYTWQFKTVEYPRVVRTEPADGAKNASPYGGMNVYFSAPMDRETLPANLKIEFYDPGKNESGVITATQVYSYWSAADTTLYLNFSMRASSLYTVALGDGLADPYSVRVPETTVVRFSTRKLDPLCYVSLPGNTGTFNAYLQTTVAVAYRNVSRLDFELYGLSADKFIDLIGYNSYSAWSKLSLDSLQKISQWSLNVQPALNDAQLKRFAVIDAAGNSPAPGLYLLQVKSPEIDYSRRTPSRYLLSISKTSVILKRTDGTAMAWVTDLQSGQPVEGASVIFQSDFDDLDTNTTDASGLSTAEFSGQDIWEPIFATVRREGDLAVASTYWSDGISPWEFGVSAEYYKTAYNGQFYTDRPIYRPGQTVYFKGIIRADDDAHYTLPPAGSIVRVTIEDSQGRNVYEQALTLSDMGTVNGELTLDAEASLGYYYLSAYLDYEINGTASFGASFRVAEYKKPEYQVEVETDLDQYVHGDMINVTAHATYYFGGPVSDAEVRWAVLTQDYYFWWEGPGWYNWTEWEWQPYWEQENYYAGYGELIAEGKGQTDANGRFTFSAPADIADKINSQSFTLEVTVTDINNQEVSNRTQTVVHKGLFYVGLSPRRYVGKAGEEQIIDVKTISIENEPVANQEITVVFLERDWYSTQKEGSDGRWYWDWELQETPVYTTTVRTNAEGNAAARWTPAEGGSYKVRALAQDARGNQIRSAAYMWVSSSKWISWRRENNDRIELIADKKEYNVGDVAEILVPSPFQGPVKALVTIERGGILDAQVITLETNSDIVRIPILEAHVPNIFVSVVIVKGMDESNELSSFKVGYIALPVSTDTKVLNITLTPDRDMTQDEYYRPRETVKYAVQVTDHSGKGVETELSLDLVDLSVLALTGGARGQALLDAFYYQRGVGIQTAASLVLNVDRVVQELPLTEGKGGGGGEMEGEGLVRTNFVDTAYWNPTLRTDANGKATVEVTLPDNLTTWRLRGRGVTAETLVGESTVDVMSTLDLLVRPVVPRFFVVG